MTEISSQKEESLKEKTLKTSLYEGASYSLMDGFGLKYITPFALAMNISNTFIGLLGSIPTLIGSLSQLKSSKMIENHSRKKIVFTSVLLQSVMWLILIGVGIGYFVFNLSILTSSILLLISYTLLITFGAFAGPAWSSWMKDLIKKNTDIYFSKRNTLVGIIALISLFTAGLILDHFETKNILLGFAIIFFIAFIGRGLSAYSFTKHYEPKTIIKENYYFSLKQFTKKLAYNNFGRFVIFSSLITFAVAISSPFFTVYMLKHLNFTYVEFTLNQISGVVATLIFMPFWGKFSNKFGNIKVLKLCGSLVFITPLLWFFSQYLTGYGQTFIIIYLILVEIISGFLWSGFNLSTSTFVFHAVTKERLPLCVAYMGILTSVGALIGAIIGGQISSYNGLIFGLHPILFVFLFGSIIRIIVVQSMVHRLKEVRPVSSINQDNLKKFFTQMMPRQMLLNAGIKRIGFKF